MIRFRMVFALIGTFFIKNECFGIPDTEDLSSRIPDEQKVFQHILSRYEASARPATQTARCVQIHFSVKLNQIIDMDERHQVLTTNLFIEQKWHDHNLQWNFTEYNRVRGLRISADKVWLPDTYVFNSADDVTSGFLRGVYVLVKNTGEVTWPVPIKLKTTCKVDITFFPFDDQLCEIWFGSWSYRQSRVEYTLAHWAHYTNAEKARDLKAQIDISGYTDNSDWILMSAHFINVTRSEGYRLFNEPQQDMLMTLHIRRRSFFYMWNIIVPCIMLTLLTLLIFWTPVESGEKISLGLSVFLALYMFMLLIAEQVPPTSESIPLIGLYLTLVMCMTATSVTMAVIVVNLHARGHKYRRAPNWVRKLFLHGIAQQCSVQHDIYSAAQKTRLVKTFKPGYAGRKSHLARQIRTVRRWLGLLNRFHRLASATSATLPHDHPYQGISSSGTLNFGCKRRCQCCPHSGGDVWTSRLGARNEEDESLVIANRRESTFERSAALKINPRISKRKQKLRNIQSPTCLQDEETLPSTSVKSSNKHSSDQSQISDPLGINESTPLSGSDRHRRDSCELRRQTLASGVDEHLLMIIEWEMISGVVDKCMFVICFLATVAIYATLFLWPQLAANHVERSPRFFTSPP